MAIRQRISDKKPTLHQLANMSISETAIALRRHYGVEDDEAKGTRLIEELAACLYKALKINPKEDELPDLVDVAVAALNDHIENLNAVIWDYQR